MLRLTWFVALGACTAAEKLPDTADTADTGCEAIAYYDGDGDGWGADDTPADGCPAPKGYVTRGGDCDDGDATVNPDATETCDARDQDCDGVVDDAPSGDANGWPDTDGDGYGAGTGVLVCGARPDGYVDNDDDGDDLDANVSPAGVEVCGGGDEDCDRSVDEGDAQDATVWYADTDGDGYGDRLATRRACTVPDGYLDDAQDCDDDDAAVHPDADERCNDADDDCDGDTDEADAVDAPTWYGDADGDGYGNASVSIAACDSPGGDFVDNADDCSDVLASVYPLAPEYCNALDDDCDGDTDEADAVDAPTWYGDADADGYGDPAAPQSACDAPADHVANGDDCDDTDATVSPAAAERCADAGTDEDCDGVVDEADAADATTWTTDADGDGYGDDATGYLACTATGTDVATGGDCDDTANNTASAVGSPSNVVVTATTTDDDDCDGVVNEGCWPTGSLTGADAAVQVYGGAGDLVGNQVSAGADLTGDGLADLATTGITSTGRVETWIVPGPLTGDVDLASGAYESICCGDSVRARLPAVDDLDADGVSDVMLRYDDDGSVLLWYGRSTGWSASADWGVAMGATLSTLATDDLDGSGYPELVTNSTGDAVAILYDPLSASPGAQVHITATSSGLYTGYQVVLPDLDGDGLGGVAFGSYVGSSLWVWDPAPSASTTTASADATFTGSGSTGGSLLAFDADEDGYDDLLVGAPQDSPATLYLLYGPLGATAGTLAAAADVSFDAPYYTGSAMAAEDVDADGAIDLFVGRHAASTSWVFLGPLPSTGAYDVTTDADTDLSHATTVSDRGFVSALGSLVDGYSGGFALGVRSDATAGTDAGAVHLFVASP